MTETPNGLGRKGFSLVELLISMTIMLLVGGTLTTLLMSSFEFWENGIASTRTLLPSARLGEQIQRDFGASLSAMGFNGSGRSCRFWILETPMAGQPAFLRQIQYDFQPNAATRRVLPMAGTQPETKIFRPLADYTLGFSDENHPGQWLSEWDSPTNAPGLLMLRSHSKPDTSRIVMRRLR